MLDWIHVTRNRYLYNMRTRTLVKPTQSVLDILPEIRSSMDLEELRIGNRISTKQAEAMKTFLFREGESSSFHANEYLEDKNFDTLQLIVFNGCNLACTYCYANEGTYNRPIHKMTFDTARKTIDLFFEKYDYVKSIVFFGGEPLFNLKLIDEVCLYATEKYTGRFMEFGMMSNLYRLTDEMVDVIKRHRIQVSTSLDGNRTVNDANRITTRGKGTFDKISKNIERLYAETCQPESIEATLTHVHNENGVGEREVIQFLSERFDVKNFTVNTMTPFKPEDQNNTYTERYRTYKEKLNIFINEGVADYDLQKFFILITGKGAQHLFCTAGLYQVSVMPDGDFYPCQIYALDTADTYFMGNIHSFSEKLFNDRREALLGLNKNDLPKCRSCYARAICRGCPGSSYANRTELPKNAVECQATQEEFVDMIELYAELYDNPVAWKAFKSKLKEYAYAAKN